MRSTLFIFIPRNVARRLENVDHTTARMLNWSMPGGQDHYFREESNSLRENG